MGYYRKFIPNFANITKPLTECLRKDRKIIINEAYQECFEKCKNLLCHNPILQYPDFEKPFTVTTDASNVALGAILSQGPIGQDLPICYASRTLSKTEQNYSTIEKELLAIVWATKYFRPYLFGKTFTIITDHKPLTWLFSLKEPNSKLVRWRLKLEEFDYKIQYKKGIQNSNADALSRIEPEAEPVIEINNSNSSSSDDNRLTTREVPIPVSASPINHFNKQLIIIIENATTLPSPIIKRETIFEKKRRVTIRIPDSPRPQTEIQEIMKEMSKDRCLTCVFISEEHYPIFYKAFQENFRPNRKQTRKAFFIRSLTFLQDILNENDQNLEIKKQHEITDHKGVIENYEHIKRNYYFPYMKEKINKHINDCTTCQRVKYDRQPPQLNLEITETPKKPMEIIHMDIFQMMSHQFLTIIDKFSKFATAYSIQDRTEKTIVGKIIKYFSRHGLPKKIIMDNESALISHAFKQLAQKYNIILHYTTPYNSTGNSPVERLHSTLKETFGILHVKNPKATMKELMQQSILSYNSSIHSTTKVTPFELLSGHIGNTNIQYISIHDYISKHKRSFTELCNHIHALTKQKKQSKIDKLNITRKSPVSIKTGQVIYAKRYRRSKLTPAYRKTVVRKNNKLTILTDLGKVHKSKVKRLFQAQHDQRTNNQPNTNENQQRTNTS